MSEPHLAAATFGLASAVSWGGGDFSGGFSARRANVLSVAPLSRVTGIAAQITLALIFREHAPSSAAVAWAVAAGVSGSIGLVALYRSLAVGKMGVNSPLTAVLAASFPVLFAALFQGMPPAVRLGGFALALGGVWCLSRPVGRAGRPHGLGLAALAGVAFGGFYLLISQVHGPSVFWPLAVSTGTSLVVMVGLAVASHQTLRVPRGVIGISLLAGVLDAGGNACFVLAAHAGRVDVAAVLGSLYPAFTALLARAVLREHLTRTQTAGIVAAVASLPLIAG
ncbi:MAG TPA: DMT family transporter [bacterium]|nr:DMT family transporter [bacterium]